MFRRRKRQNALDLGEVKTDRPQCAGHKLFVQPVGIVGAGDAIRAKRGGGWCDEHHLCQQAGGVHADGHGRGAGGGMNLFHGNRIDGRRGQRNHNMGREVKNSAVIEALSDAVRAYGVKRIAAEFGRTPASIYGELNPYGDQTKAKVSFDDAIEMIRLTGDTMPLKLAAASLGLTVSEKVVVPDKETVCEEIADDMEIYADFVRVCRDLSTSQADVRKVRDAVRREIDQTEKLAIKEREKRDARYASESNVREVRQ